MIHAFQRDRLDLRSITSRTESFVTSDTYIAHGLDGFAEEFTWVELARVGGHQATHGAGGCQAQVGVDVDLAHAVLDAFDDFFNPLKGTDLFKPRLIKSNPQKSPHHCGVSFKHLRLS